MSFGVACLTGLTDEERAIVHKAARRLDLKTKSWGEGDERFVRAYPPDSQGMGVERGGERAGESGGESGDDGADHEESGARDELRLQAEEAVELAAARHAMGTERLGNQADVEP